MSPPDLLDRAYEYLRAADEATALGDLAVFLLHSDDSPMARHVVGSLLARDPRFRVEGGRVTLAPKEDGLASVSLSDLTFAVVDFETNGLPPGDRAIEIGLSCWRGGREVASFESLLDPGTGIAPFVTRLTGIREADLRGRPAFEEILPDVTPLLDGAVLVAHNLPFDRRVLLSELARAGIKGHLDTPGVCTLRLARRLLPKDDRKNLDTLAERFGLTFVARHRALGDAQVTGGLLHRLLDMAAEAAPIETLDHLLQFMEPPARKGVREAQGKPGTSGAAL